jgi:hypothetical protein
MKFLYYFGKTLVERNVAGSRLVSIMEASGVAWLAGLTSTYLAVLLLAPLTGWDDVPVMRRWFDPGALSLALGALAPGWLCLLIARRMRKSAPADQIAATRADSFD